MRDEELVLRFFAFWMNGVEAYRTPQKHWLNDTAKAGKKLSEGKIAELDSVWKKAIHASLEWFKPAECFRREGVGRTRAINRALFDLVMHSAARVGPEQARNVSKQFRKKYTDLLRNEEFIDLISRAVDHKKRTIRRFAMWEEIVGSALP